MLRVQSYMRNIVALVAITVVLVCGGCRKGPSSEPVKPELTASMRQGQSTQTGPVPTQQRQATPEIPKPTEPTAAPDLGDEKGVELSRPKENGNCYEWHEFADQAHSTSESRKQDASGMQEFADKRWGPKKIHVETIGDGSEYLVVIGLRENEDIVRQMDVALSLPKFLARACVQGFAQIDIYVMDDPSRVQKIGIYSTNEVWTMNYLKQH